MRCPLWLSANKASVMTRVSLLDGWGLRSGWGGCGGGGCVAGERPGWKYAAWGLRLWDFLGEFPRQAEEGGAGNGVERGGGNHERQQAGSEAGLA